MPGGHVLPQHPGPAGALLVPAAANSATDDALEIGIAIADGLQFGVGDAVIGINPVNDSVRAERELLAVLDDVIARYAIPTQTCVLAHVTNTLAAIAAGAPVDLVFQSIAGTQAANRAFGVTWTCSPRLQQAALSLRRRTVGTTSCTSRPVRAPAFRRRRPGVDQQTLEARAYAVARRYAPLIVNSVVGFIGPEYLFDGKQIRRAGLEDHFCGKLLGLPMGVDVCYTNHAEADADDADDLLTLLAVAGCTYVMGFRAGTT